MAGSSTRGISRVAGPPRSSSARFDPNETSERDEPSEVTGTKREVVLERRREERARLEPEEELPETVTPPGMSPPIGASGMSEKRSRPRSPKVVSGRSEKVVSGRSPKVASPRPSPAARRFTEVESPARSVPESETKRATAASELRARSDMPTTPARTTAGRMIEDAFRPAREAPRSPGARPGRPRRSGLRLDRLDHHVARAQVVERPIDVLSLPLELEHHDPLLVVDRRPADVRDHREVAAEVVEDGLADPLLGECAADLASDRSHLARSVSKKRGEAV